MHNNYMPHLQFLDVEERKLIPVEVAHKEVNPCRSGTYWNVSVPPSTIVAGSYIDSTKFITLQTFGHMKYLAGENNHIGKSYWQGKIWQI